MAKTIQLMLLFNFLHRSDSASFAYKENPLSIMDNDAALAKRNYFIKKSSFMSLTDDGHVFSQSLLLPKRELGRISYDNSNSIIFINENSYILCSDKKRMR